MKNIIVLLICFLTLNCYSQDKLFTKTGKAYFMSHTDAIDIDGTNKQVISFIDTKTGDINAAMLIKGFEFTLATAAEHFNETYMESHLFPKANFKGKINEFEKIDLKKNGSINATVTGDLTIHGATKTITEPIILVIKDGVVTGKCNFKASINDYAIKVPSVVENRVAKIVDVQLEFEYKPYQKP
jgi:polyisoprenoid-binding protein YceI